MSKNCCSPIVVSDAHDLRLAPFRDIRDADLRGRDNLFLIESEMVLRRAVKAEVELHSVLITPAKYDRLSGILNYLEGVPIYLAPLDVIKKIAGFDVHRGVLAAGYRPKLENLKAELCLDRIKVPNRLLLVEGVTNIDNIGGLFRTAAALGWEGVFLNKDSGDPLYRKSIRVSMGHVFSVTWGISSDWGVFIKKLKENNYEIIGSEITTNSVLPRKRNSKIALIVGSEGQGVSSDTLNVCDQLVAIPMAKEVDSLNVVVASAIIMYALG